MSGIIVTRPLCKFEDVARNACLLSNDVWQMIINILICEEDPKKRFLTFYNTYVVRVFALITSLYYKTTVKSLFNSEGFKNMIRQFYLTREYNGFMKCVLGFGRSCAHCSDDRNDALHKRLVYHGITRFSLCFLHATCLYGVEYYPLSEMLTRYGIRVRYFEKRGYPVFRANMTLNFLVKDIEDLLDKRVKSSVKAKETKRLRSLEAGGAKKKPKLLIELR